LPLHRNAAELPVVECLARKKCVWVMWVEHDCACPRLRRRHADLPRDRERSTPQALRKWNRGDRDGRPCCVHV